MPDKIQQLTTIERWITVYEASSAKPIFVFKHSTRCPISAGAHEEFTNFMEDALHPRFDAFIVRVVEERAVSNAISETLGLMHASPQAILIHGGKVVWHDSHWSITYSSLEEHLGEHCEK